MLTDVHTHVLPNMDDGSQSLDMSLEMLTRLHAQGVERVVATPHFYLHREPDPAAYLTKRQMRFDALVEQQLPMELRLGAEVAIEQGISDLPQIRALTITGTDLILLECPLPGKIDTKKHTKVE